MINLKLTTLTPLFIGSGKELESFDYTILGNKFYKLDTNTILNYITSKDSTAIDKFDNWIDDTTSKNQQNQNSRVQNLNILKFIQNYLHNQQLLQDVKNQISSGKFSNYVIPSYVEPNFNKKVLSCLKTADNKVYIPGSTIKGMIRTALLYDYLQRIYSEDYQLFDSYIQILKRENNKIQNNRRNSNDNKKEFANRLINEIFVCKDEKGNFDAKFDLMKLIKVSDSNCFDPYDVCELRLPDIVKRQGFVTSNLPSIEFIKQGTEFEFTLDFEVDYFRNVYKKYQKERNQPEHNWKGLDTKFEKLFQISLYELSTNDIKETLFENITFSILNFHQIVAEIDNNFQVVRPNLWNNLNSVNYNLNKDIIVAKLSWGGGYHSKTIYPLNFPSEGQSIEEFNDLYQKIIDIFKIGYSQNHNQNQQVELQKIPKTRKAVKINNFYNQMGWVKIERIRKD